MIIHSTSNTIDGKCLVQVEGIEPGSPEQIVRLFAQGAAGAHNKSHVVAASALVWVDDQGRALSAEVDTTDATCARVLCGIEKP